MAMNRGDRKPVAVAVFAKAPIPGLAKTRLATRLGFDGAAKLQARFIERTVGAAVEAGVGAVTLWTAPDERHPLFGELARRFPIALARQPEGDIGVRMLAAFTTADQPRLVIGVDCPALSAAHLRDAAVSLATTHEAVLIPVEDGGYVLIGARGPRPDLFDGISWSTPAVMAQTRARLRAAKLAWRELPPLWDVDEPGDLDRMQREGFGDLLD